MHHATAKRLDRYFDNPPAVDWIDAPGRRVLACPIEASPCWRSPQTLLAEQLCAAQRAKDARLRRHEERLAGEEHDVDHVERTLDVAPPRIFRDETPPAKRNAKPVRSRRVSSAARWIRWRSPWMPPSATSASRSTRTRRA